MDIDNASQPDILGSMTDMSSVPSASYDAVFSSHSIEHLYPHEVPTALAEFRRVLKPTGFVIITCPDMQSICALVAEGNLTGTAYVAPVGPIAPIDIIYGHRPSLASGQLHMAHKCGFTKTSLIETLKQADFISIACLDRGKPYFELWALAFVSLVPEPDVRVTATTFFPGLAPAPKTSSLVTPR